MRLYQLTDSDYGDALAKLQEQIAIHDFTIQAGTEIVKTCTRFEGKKMTRRVSNFIKEKTRYRAWLTTSYSPWFCLSVFDPDRSYVTAHFNFEEVFSMAPVENSISASRGAMGRFAEAIRCLPEWVAEYNYKLSEYQKIAEVISSVPGFSHFS